MSEERDPKGEPTKASPALRPATRPGSVPLKGPPRAQERPLPAPRGKLASAEEISESLILPDDDPKAPAKATFAETDAEELSGSLLLDDPTGPRGPERAVIMPAVTRPGSARPGGPRPSPSVKPPVPHSVKPPPPKSVKPPSPTSGKPPSPASPNSGRPPPPSSVKPPPPRGAALPAPPPPSPVSARVPDALPQVPPTADTNGLHHPPNGLAERVEAAPTPGTTPGAADDDRMYEAKTLPIGAVPAIVLERIVLRTSGAAEDAAAEGEAAPARQEPATEPHATEGPATEPHTSAEPELPALPMHHAIPRGDGVRRFVERIATAVRERQRRPFDGELPPWFLSASTGAGVAIGVGAVLVITSLLRPAPAVETVAPIAPEASAAAVLPPPPEPAKIVAPAAPSAAPAAAPAGPPQACKLAGAPAILAPTAVLSAGIEARALGEDDVALGFASNEHEAVGLRFHPSAATTTAAGTATQRARAAIRRVTPFLSTAAKGGLELAVDGDAKGDTLVGRRTLPFDPPIQIGTTPDGLAWAKRNAAPAGKLWSLDGDGDVQALRAAADPSAATGNAAVAFRRGDAIDIGVFTAGDSPSPNGDLTRIEGLGGGVGSPAIAINDGVVFAVWADRASNDAPWSLRWVRFESGHSPGTPMTFTPPPGGKGDQAMSPSVAALPDRRFLLVWAEGHVSDHDVRALRLSEDGKPIGDPLDVSSAGSNAGQGQAAVTSAGHGLIGFLESGDKGFHVAATRVECSGP